MESYWDIYQEGLSTKKAGNSGIRVSRKSKIVMDKSPQLQLNEVPVVIAQIRKTHQIPAPTLVIHESTASQG